MQKAFAPDNFPARVGPRSFLGLALVSQTGMSFVQQGLVVMGVFFLAAYHLSLTQLGLITTALSLGVMTSMVFVGITVDRVGPRIVLFWGAILAAGLSSLLLAVNSYTMLLVVLFCVGISLAVVPSSGTKAVFTAFVGRPRGLVMGIRQTGVPLGAALAAWLLPRLVPQWHLDPVYLLFSLELLVTGWAFSAVMRDWRQKGASKPERIRLTGTHWKQLVRPISIAFLMVSGQYILLTYSIADLSQVHHLSVAVAGAVLALSQVGGGVGRVVLGQLSDRIGGRRPPVLALAGGLATSLAFVIGILPRTAPVWTLFLIWTLFGFGAVGWNALALTWAGESVPISHSGFAMSLTGTIVFLGSSVFPPLFGLLVDQTHHFATGWWALSGLLLCATVMTVSRGRPGAGQRT